jgi:hypothetical protein
LVIIAIYIVVLLLTALLGTLFPGVPALLVPAGVGLLVAAVAVIRRAAIRRLGTTKTLCVLFLSLAAAHIFFGFLLADLTTQHTSIRSNAEVYFANALLINSVGLLAAGLGYAWKLNGEAFALQRGFPAPIDSELAEHLFRLLVVIGAVMMFVVYWRLGLWDYLRVPTKWPFLRYITSEIAGGSATDEWFANRAMDLLTVSIPFLVYRASKRPRIVGIVLIITGYLALLLPLRRANLLGVLFASVILVGIGRHNVYHLTRKWLLIMAGFYIFTQCLFLFGVFYDDLHPQTVLAVSSTALPEVRDLAWTLNRLDGQRLNGVTFAQALIPLPSIASDWSAQHSLRAITTKLIGIDQTGESGGLRLTIMGEAYINFGYLGVIVVSFLWGCGVAWCDSLLCSIQRMRSEFSTYIAVMCFISLCFLIYLAGTQAGASIKVGALLIWAVAWAGKYPAQFIPAPAEAAGA